MSLQLAKHGSVRLVPELALLTRATLSNRTRTSLLARPRPPSQTVANILRQAYGRKEAVTDELVQAILRPGLQPGAVSVFLDFISYSGGPRECRTTRAGQLAVVYAPRPVLVLQAYSRMLRQRTSWTCWPCCTCML